MQKENIVFLKDVKGMQITFQIQYMNEKYWLQKLSLVRIKLRIRANLGQSKGVFSSEQGRIQLSGGDGLTSVCSRIYHRARTNLAQFREDFAQNKGGFTLA